LTQRLLNFNRHIPWPVSPFIAIVDPKNIEFDPDDLNNFQTFGCYFQNFAAKIVIGKGTYIAPNVGIITANHDPSDPERHLPAADVVIGENCWIGMNSVILPGVHLGPGTVVAACSLVTRSFRKGHVTVGGVPAQLLMTRTDDLKRAGPD
jgi:acetyltransferase-like isoleucine patch superfamily enzyme